MAVPILSLDRYMNILRDINCLKILYYLHKFNPNISVEELSNNLHIGDSVTRCCISKLVDSKLVLRENAGGYSLTPFCRSAFKELLDK